MCHGCYLAHRDPVVNEDIPQEESFSNLFEHGYYSCSLINGPPYGKIWEIKDFIASNLENLIKINDLNKINDE